VRRHICAGLGRPECISQAAKRNGLPNGEDGLVLMRRVRERPADLGGRTPAIALTAYASATDRRQALAAGYQTYLAKPFEPPDLVAAVASLLSVQKPISSDDT